MTTELTATLTAFDVSHSANQESFPFDGSENGIQLHADTAVLVPEKTVLNKTAGKEKSHWPEKRFATERRLQGNRFPAAMGVALFKNGVHQGSATIRNVALRGLFLETALEMAENTVVQLRLHVRNEQGGVEPHCMWGRVVHSSAKGMGVHLDILHPDTDAGLQAVLSHARH